MPEPARTLWTRIPARPREPGSGGQRHRTALRETRHGVWEAAAATIGARARHELGEAVGVDPKDLGPGAGDAVSDRMYAGIRVEARKALLLITTTAADGVERTRRSPAEARGRFESEGLNAALVGMRQDADEVRRAATAAAHVGPARRVVRLDLKRALQVD